MLTAEPIVDPAPVSTDSLGHLPAATHDPRAWEQIPWDEDQIDEEAGYGYGV